MSSKRRGEILEVRRKKDRPEMIDPVKVRVRWDYSQSDEWVLPVALRFVELNADKPLQEVMWAIQRKNETSKLHLRHEGSCHTLCDRIIEVDADYSAYVLGTGVECQYCSNILKGGGKKTRKEQRDGLQMRRTLPFTVDNRKLVAQSTRCGCFYCLIEFEPGDIYRWAKQTAFCPQCQSLTVLPDAAPVPTGIIALRKLKKWYGEEGSGTVTHG